MFNKAIKKLLASIAHTTNKQKTYLIAGLKGIGKSTTLNMLSELDDNIKNKYYCVYIREKDFEYIDSIDISDIVFNFVYKIIENDNVLKDDLQQKLKTLDGYVDIFNLTYDKLEREARISFFKSSTMSILSLVNESIATYKTNSKKDIILIIDGLETRDVINELLRKNRSLVLLNNLNIIKIITIPLELSRNTTIDFGEIIEFSIDENTDSAFQEIIKKRLDEKIIEDDIEKIIKQSENNTSTLIKLIQESALSSLSDTDNTVRASKVDRSLNIKMELENIGLLKKANIRIDGLNVIAGKNNTGKSTVGKVLFCIIKAINRYQEDFRSYRISEIEDVLDELFFHYTQNIPNKKENIREIFSIDRLDTKDKFDEFLKIIKQDVDELNLSMTDKEFIFTSKGLLEKLDNALLIPRDKKIFLEKTINNIFGVEFNSIQNVLQLGKNEGRIKLIDTTVLIDLKVTKDKITIQGDIRDLAFKDSTFVETSLILNNYDLLIKSRTVLDERNLAKLDAPYTTIHTKDLFDKLITQISDSDNKNEYKKIISKIINGDILFDREKKDFVYRSSSEDDIAIINTATGIKSFGLLQLLIDRDFINKKSLLILDEPENHIHPQWQLKYAELISVLVKNDISIILTSHSPYMIEALKRYSDGVGLEDKSNFYLSGNGSIGGGSKLSKIFSILSEPFDVFRKMDAEDLKNE